MHAAQDRLVLLNTGHRKCNKAEITLSVYYNHKPMRLEINYKKEKNPAKPTNTQGLNNMLLSNQLIPEEIEVYLETNEMKTQRSKTFGMLQRQF